MGKSRKGEMTIEEALQAVLEMMGWQAELLRAALRQVRKQTGGGGRPPEGKSARRS